MSRFKPGHFHMKDIQNRSDIDLLMRDSYGRLLEDVVISYIFTHVAKIDLEHHLSIIGDFWEQNLLHTGKYKNNVLQIHQLLNQKAKLTAGLFEIWLDHFYVAIDSNFQGENSENAKTRALSIATIMKIKMQ